MKQLHAAQVATIHSAHSTSPAGNLGPLQLQDSAPRDLNSRHPFPHAMPKRPNSEPLEPPPKRLRPNFIPHIKRLSDELFLRIASFLPIADLTSCQRASKRFSRIATDSQIWKALFYRRFVRPRASRIPGASRAPSSSLHYSSRNSRWLEDEGLVRTSATNWKELYKLRHNWNRGICGVSEIDIAASAPRPPPIPPLLVRLHEVRKFIPAF